MVGGEKCLVLVILLFFNYRPMTKVILQLLAPYGRINNIVVSIYFLSTYMHSYVRFYIR